MEHLLFPNLFHQVKVSPTLPTKAELQSQELSAPILTRGYVSREKIGVFCIYYLLDI